GYQRVKDVAFESLVYRLSIRQIPGEDHTERELLWLTVRQGLSRSVLLYLWRNRVRCEASKVEPQGAAGTFGQGGSLLLVRVHDLPERMLTLFRKVPGVEVHRPVGDNCVVQVGFRHPFRLESCAAVFEKDKFYVFSGARD